MGDYITIPHVEDRICSKDGRRIGGQVHSCEIHTYVHTVGMYVCGHVHMKIMANKGMERECRWKGCIRGGGKD